VNKNFAIPAILMVIFLPYLLFGDRHDYGIFYEAMFLSGCETKATPGQCSCLLTWLERTESVGELVATYQQTGTLGNKGAFFGFVCSFIGPIFY
jgi:hypothetical protein